MGLGLRLGLGVVSRVGARFRVVLLWLLDVWWLVGAVALLLGWELVCAREWVRNLV